MKLKIIEAEYDVIQGKPDDPEFLGIGSLGEPAAAYTDKMEKKIILAPKGVADDTKTEDGWFRFQKDCVLHELIHGYCYETGVGYDSDEDLVEWIARNILKIVSSYKEVMRSGVWK